MLRWEDDKPFCKKNTVYKVLMKIARKTLEGMVLTAEGIYKLAEIEGAYITPMIWEAENIVLEISEVVPEEDLFYVTVNVFPINDKNYNYDYGVGPILYCYTVNKNHIGREVLFFPESPIIYNEGEDVLNELISILKILTVT